MPLKPSYGVLRPEVHSTTILAVRRNNRVAVAGDGQVTFDKTIISSLALPAQQQMHSRYLLDSRLSSNSFTDSCSVRRLNSGRNGEQTSIFDISKHCSSSPTRTHR